MAVAYRSQRVAYPYFVVALLLFLLQVLVGTWLAVNYWASLPQGLVDVFPFSTARAIHTNLLVLWLLLMVKALRGEWYSLPIVGKMAEEKTRK